MSEGGLTLDAALALGDDSVNGGESEAGGEGGVFGGEEWFEDALQGCFVHADAGIGDSEEDAGRSGSGSGADGGNGGGDLQTSALGHCDAGIVGQMHEDQSELFGIDEDVADGLIELQIDGDADADDAGEHGESFADAVVEVDDAGLEHLAPAEGEKLARDLGGARGLLQDVEELGLDGRGELVLQGELAGEADGLGNVVEVVSNATGKTPTASMRWEWLSCSSTSRWRVMSRMYP